MPTTADNKIPSEYYVVNGERREVSEMDVNWIKENCNITRETAE
jgi:hypothetical protein